MKIPKIIKSPLTRALHAIANRMSEPNTPQEVSIAAPENMLVTDENGEPVAIGTSYGWQNAKTPINDFFESLPKQLIPTTTDEKPLPDPYIRPTHYETLLQADSEPLDGKLVQPHEVEVETLNTQANETVEPKYLTLSEFYSKYEVKHLGEPIQSSKGGISGYIATEAMRQGIIIRKIPTLDGASKTINAYPVDFLIAFFAKHHKYTFNVPKPAITATQSKITSNTSLPVPTPLDGMPLIMPNEVLGEVVNARELHQFLEVKTRFNDWLTRRIDKFGFEINIDFIANKALLKNEYGENTGFQDIDYLLSVDMAKEICMLEANEKGQMARRYYIECEKQLRNISKVNSPSNTVVDLSSVDNRMQNMAVYLKKTFDIITTNQQTIIQNQLALSSRVEGIEQNLITTITNQSNQLTQTILSSNATLIDKLSNGFRGLHGRLSNLTKNSTAENCATDSTEQSQLQELQVISPEIPTNDFKYKKHDIPNASFFIEQYCELNNIPIENNIKLGKAVKSYADKMGHVPELAEVPNELRWSEYGENKAYVYPEKILKDYFQVN